MKINEETVAIVTGAASGLGEATARALASAGAPVAVFDLDDERGVKLAEEIQGLFVKVDVSDTENVRAAVETVYQEAGPPRIAVNCAGIAIAQKTVSKGEPHDMDLFRKVINVNLIGTANVATLAAQKMVEASPLTDDGERGVIINTASVAAFDGQIGQIAYSASKGAVHGMTLPMARDLSRDGVRVVTIAPGLFGTPMLLGMPQEVQDALGAQVPFPSRLGNPAEYGALVRSIVENSMLNGETIRLDGAIRMAPK
ncbi:MAG: 3-hydroxyacyl-CoA dehydrogenase [Pseudomonadota bacterium]